MSDTEPTAVVTQQPKRALPGSGLRKTISYGPNIVVYIL